MNPKKKKAVELLHEAVSSARDDKQDKDIQSLGDLSKALSAANDMTEQKKLVKDFVDNHKEFHKFLEENPDFVNSEAERALLETAFGAESVTEEERTDSRGRKSYKRTVHRNAPNLNALLEWLRNKDPENWSPNPQAEPELEDTSELEEEIYGKKKQGS
ncbi:hypothetical protein [Ruminococcus flavefaciens]|uniref:hypothetical protein n=1 Tax=Ruminococcus flavefaciens TaxID=1265 RepID=UPI0026EE5F8E|nr:hypothetical protein [Ruminococcus flavefaciens]